MGRRSSNYSQSPVRGSPRRSPRRERSRGDSSPAREKLSGRGESPPRSRKLSSPISRSSSPRTKRLKKAQIEKDSRRDSERGSERHKGKGSDRHSHVERSTDREIDAERKESRSGRNGFDGRSSKSRHGRSTSPLDHRHKSRHRSRSPQPARGSRARDEVTNSRGAEHRDDEDESVAKMKAAEEALATKEKEKPSFELSGKLAAETNRARGVTLLFTEPPEARKPNIRWRLYVFKGGEVLNEPLYIHRQSCYLFGRERRVADIPTDHPSCSKQHAVIQFRQVETEQPDGTMTKQVRPYVMDLGSTNKTFLNDNPIEPQRYYELFEKDTIKFGNSSREYVILHENSAE